LDVVEKNVEVKVDEYASKISEKILGTKNVPWFKFSYNLTILYAALTCFVLFHRPDFFNVKFESIIHLYTS
jgi:hypothetical protein